MSSTRSSNPIPLPHLRLVAAAGLALLLSPGARAQSAYAVAPGPDPALQGKIEVYDGGAQTEIPAFTSGYGAHVAFADVDGDDRSEVLAGEGPAFVNANRVRGFRRDGTPVPNLDFMAYASGQGGVQVAGVQLPYTTSEEFVTLPGLNAPFGPQVRGWKYVLGNPPGVAPLAQINYYLSPLLATRAVLSQGDFDGDGYEEILTTEATQQMGTWLTATSFSGTPHNVFRVLVGGKEVHAAGGDVDGDAFDELLLGSKTSTGAPRLRGFNVDGGTFTAMSSLNFEPFLCMDCSVRPAAGDLDGDGSDEMLVGATTGKPMVRAFDYSGGWVSYMWDEVAFPAGKYGARPAVSDSLN